MEAIVMCAVRARPEATNMTRRHLVTAAAAVGASMSIDDRFARAAAGPERRFDFTQPLDGWMTVSGKWAIEEVAGASQGGRALVQRATNNDFNVIVAPCGTCDTVEVLVSL